MNWISAFDRKSTLVFPGCCSWKWIQKISLCAKVRLQFCGKLSFNHTPSPPATQSAEGRYAQKLLNDLMENYSSALRPVEDTDRALNVTLQITLSQIKDMVGPSDTLIKHSWHHDKIFSFQSPWVNVWVLLPQHAKSKISHSRGAVLTIVNAPMCAVERSLQPRWWNSLAAQLQTRCKVDSIEGTLRENRWKSLSSEDFELIEIWIWICKDLLKDSLVCVAMKLYSS